jgi:hypothetical protein
MLSLIIATALFYKLSSKRDSYHVDEKNLSQHLKTRSSVLAEERVDKQKFLRIPLLS